MSSSLFAVKAYGLADATYPTVICRTQLRLVMKSISVQTPGSRQDMCGTNAVPKGDDDDDDDADDDDGDDDDNDDDGDDDDEGDDDGDGWLMDDDG